MAVFSGSSICSLPLKMVKLSFSMLHNVWSIELCAAVHCKTSPVRVIEQEIVYCLACLQTIDKPDICSLQGAIYVTDNGAFSWSAAVQETVDATLNRTVSSGECRLWKQLYPQSYMNGMQICMSFVHTLRHDRRPVRGLAAEFWAFNA